ncbi:sugar ABC transporter substrate-binding protein [Paenibacillus sp. YYML68]|uniref:ABC transporter substrate-binding protein n=1 Tax=Paenibacillus sp. YYML68 TaxID=2909250 RepID=UPI00248F4D5B|nr:sugar ABC transporter substrate-binding protein [Paenibacillus sp. YYML68]
MFTQKSKRYGIQAMMLLLLPSIALSACSTNTPPSTAVSEAAKEKTSDASTNNGLSGTLKVQMIGDFSIDDKTDPVTGKKSKGLKVLKAEFEKRYPNTKVEFVLMGWDNYNEKTQTMLQSGAADVYQVPGIATFAEQGLLEPLQSYIDKDSFDTSIYLNGQVDGWRAMGPSDQKPEIYGLPFIGDARLIVYDKQLFDEWGVPYLSEAPTMEEVLEKAAKMTGKNPKSGEPNYGLTFNGNDAADTVMNINESKGGQWGSGFLWKDMKLEFDTPTMLESVQLLKEAKKYAPEGVLVNQGSENFLMKNNNIAIHLRSAPGFINAIDTFGTQDRYQAALLFKNPKNGMGGMFAGSPFAIGKNSKSKELAWEWLKFSGSEFFQEYLWQEHRSQSMPVIKKAASWDSVKALPQMDIILKQMSQLWAPRYPYRSGQPRYILSEHVQRILLGEMPAEEGLKKAQEKATQWVESQKK